MNIFILSEDPVEAAQMCDDVRCNKIVLEAAQVLATCFTNEELQTAPFTKNGTAWKHTHVNHPISVWVRSSKQNALWAIKHAFALEDERLYRRYNPHHSMGFINWISKNIDKCNLPNIGLTPFAVVISDDKRCRLLKDFNKFTTVEKYRAFFVNDKNCKWSVRSVPHWFNESKYVL